MNENSSDQSQNDEDDSSKLPVIFVDQYHRTYDMIRRYIDKKLLPEFGNTIIHLNAHIDDIVPEDLQIHVQMESKLTKTKLYQGIGTLKWLKIAAEIGCLKHVVWVKPPWSIQVDDGHFTNENGILDIKTLGKSIFENNPEDYEGFKKIFSDLKPGDPYILDIAYSYFSSDNPFTSDYPKAKDYYSMLKNVFELKIPETKTKENIEIAAKKRKEQLEDLLRIFQNLDQHRTLLPKESINPEIYQKVSDLRAYLLEFYDDENIMWKSIYSAGVVANDYQLPVHHTSKEDIKKLLECVGKMLDLLPSPPSLITIAIMYEYDRYTPENTYEYIAESLEEFFGSRYENVQLENEDF